jgi:SAM-dependent methyltransferase
MNRVSPHIAIAAPGFNGSSQLGLTSELLQQAHYERIARDYDAHYNDTYSQRYMNKFVFDFMFKDIDVADFEVLEAMCGGGQTTEYLLDRRATVTGLDISPQQTDHFEKRHPRARAITASMLNSGFQDRTFDLVSIVGGIHHMPPYVDEAIEEVHRILKPGGYFCFMEPHSEAAMDRVRRFWYKRDPLFAENEEAINMTELHDKFSDRFEFKNEYYGGNFGYLFVLNSMVFRVPLFLKPLYSPAMIATESLFNKIGGKTFSCFVVAQWRKK